MELKAKMRKLDLIINIDPKIPAEFFSDPQRIK